MMSSCYKIFFSLLILFFFSVLPNNASAANCVSDFGGACKYASECPGLTSGVSKMEFTDDCMSATGGKCCAPNTTQPPTTPQNTPEQSPPRTVNPGTVNGAGIVPCVGDSECTACNLRTMGANIINFFVIISVIVAALLFVNAGVLYVTSPANPGNISRAHSIFVNTLLGLLLILASWLLIDTVMKTLYDVGNTGWGPWNEIICDGIVEGETVLHTDVLDDNTPPTVSLVPAYPQSDATIMPNVVLGDDPTTANTGTVGQERIEPGKVQSIPFVYNGSSGMFSVDGSLPKDVTISSEKGDMETNWNCVSNDNPDGFVSFGSVNTANPADCVLVEGQTYYLNIKNDSTAQDVYSVAWETDPERVFVSNPNTNIGTGGTGGGTGTASHQAFTSGTNQIDYYAECVHLKADGQPDFNNVERIKKMVGFKGRYNPHDPWMRQIYLNEPIEGCFSSGDGDPLGKDEKGRTVVGFVYRVGGWLELHGEDQIRRVRVFIPPGTRKVSWNLHTYVNLEIPFVDIAYRFGNPIGGSDVQKFEELGGISHPGARYDLLRTYENTNIYFHSRVSPEANQGFIKLLNSNGRWETASPPFSEPAEDGTWLYMDLPCLDSDSAWKSIRMNTVTVTFVWDDYVAWYDAVGTAGSKWKWDDFGDPILKNPPADTFSPPVSCSDV